MRLNVVRSRLWEKVCFDPRRVSTNNVVTFRDVYTKQDQILFLMEAVKLLPSGTNPNLLREQQQALYLLNLKEFLVAMGSPLELPRCSLASFCSCSCLFTSEEGKDDEKSSTFLQFKSVTVPTIIRENAQKNADRVGFSNKGKKDNDRHSFYSVYEVATLGHLVRQPGPKENNPPDVDRSYENIISIQYNKDPVYIEVETNSTNPPKAATSRMPDSELDSAVVYAQVHH